jgi:hypothetical protein
MAARVSCPEKTLTMMCEKVKGMKCSYGIEVLNVTKVNKTPHSDIFSVYRRGTVFTLLTLGRIRYHKDNTITFKCKDCIISWQNNH